MTTPTHSIAAAAETATPQTVTLILRRITARFLKAEPESLEADTNLVHRGLGSLEIMRIVSELRRAGITAEVRELATDPTLKAWTEHLLRAHPADEIVARLA